MTSEIERIGKAKDMMERLIAGQDDGIRYMPYLRRLRAELEVRANDEAEVLALRARVRSSAARRKAS